MKRFAIWLVLATLLPLTAQAQDSDAWTLIQKGQGQVERGKLAPALASFRKAIELEPRNGTAINAAAQVASFLELPGDSIFYYTAYLYLEADYMGDAETVKKALAKQATLLENGAMLKATVVPEDGELLVNGVPLGKGGFSLPAESGKPYEIEVQVEDYHPYKETIILQAGETKDLAIKLKKIVYFGKVKLKVLPREEVKIYVDTKYVGTSMEEVEAVEGKRLVCFKKEGFDRWWRYVNVPRNDTFNLEVVLRNQSRPDGECTVWPEEEGY
jgi:tetratricopeptide (TPR) repeat protein